MTRRAAFKQIEITRASDPMSYPVLMTVAEVCEL